ncbi:NADP-dependent oxidoreductase [Nocardiopsis mangrovi]|uniref:NADP-dependent oxidoreductase n=1 Tax=Nocardiopsis mangrovi TaxID=1179818 RepID=A0ABV9E6B0_9ACTN
MGGATETMRAVVQDGFGDADVLYTAEVPRPRPLPTEVLVRVHAAGVNPVDWKTRSGGGMSAVLGEPPFILGWDVSGVVAEVGFGVNTLRIGDEVFGMPWFPRPAGAYAEYVTAPSRQFTRKPDALDHEHAAAVPLAALTAWQTVTGVAHVEPGDRVLVHAAAGGVGHFAVQLAKERGAWVIGTASSRNHAWLRELGAHDVIDYHTDRFEEVIADGVDAVIDLVGDAVDRTSTRSLEVLRPGGILVAVPSGVTPELLDLAAQRGVRASAFMVEPDGAALTEVARLIDAGAISVYVDGVFPLAEVADAHRRSEESHGRGKFVLRVAD